MRQEYVADIGMECHAELRTQSKMYCACPNLFGGEPNTRCCPVCSGMPGALPVINKGAVEQAVRAALALNCSVDAEAQFDRKNYFYPDLPKGYQISEYERPIGRDGWLDIVVSDQEMRVRIQRVHVEEDTGKLYHLPGDERESLVDLNRSGVPLVEIVTAFPPDLHTAAAARAYLVALRDVLTFIDVCDGKMEQGSLRCEPNVSVRPAGSATPGTKAEIKNLNSFRSVERGIDYEIQRQTQALRSGRPVLQQTRGWNETAGATVAQRSKEAEQEYRYFPDPDLAPLRLDEAWVATIRSSMPELPAARRARFRTEFALSSADALQLTSTRSVADYFEQVVHASGNARAAATWIMGDLTRLVNAANADFSDCPVTPAHLAAMVRLVDARTITGRMAKTMLDAMFATGDAPDAVLAARGWQPVTDPDAIRDGVREVFAANPQIVDDIVIRGLVRKKGYLVGQAMKAFAGRADPERLNAIIDDELERARADGTDPDS